MPLRRRQRVTVGSEDGESNAGEAEGREEQDGAVGGVAMGSGSGGEVPMAAPNLFECAICCTNKPMESAVKVVSCTHPQLVCGGCMFTEVYGNAAICSLCRELASELEQVATGRRYEVTDTTLSRIHTQGGVLAEPNHPDACHKCHKFGFLLVCDGCEQNRCLKCSGLDCPPEESDPFSCETCAAKARAATPGPPDTAGNVAMAEGGGAGGTHPASPTNEQAAPAQAARQTKAQEASERCAKFQQEQRSRVHAPPIAESGMLAWGGVSVEVAQLDESKV